MMNAATKPRPGCEFDRFLYASIGDDTNGMPLTVLSALARMDVDPWEEASKLTQMPQESAVEQLASLLGALRNSPLADLEPARIVAPLIALLPCPRDPAAPKRKAFSQFAPTKHPAAVSTLLTALTCVIFMLLSQWLLGSLESLGHLQPTSTPTPASASPSAAKSGEGSPSPAQ
jgi:hypothetical protein